MLDTLFIIIIGMFIGWNLPQPAYAKWIQEWIMSKIRSFASKKEDADKK